MKFVNIFLLLILSLWLSVKPQSKTNKYIIVGAGPVGLYLSHELLKLKSTEKVTIYEARKEFTRPQCLRIPFEIAIKLPEEIKKELWPNPETRNTLFKSRTESDPDFKDFWPSLGYQYFPRINVGDLQTVFLNYLESKYSTKFKIEYSQDKKGVESNEVVEHYGKSNEVDIVFITAGNGDFNKKVRNDLGKYNNDKTASTTYDFTDKPDFIFDGVYLVYKNKNSNNEKIEENYIRSYGYMNKAKFSKDGITYSATNNKEGMVQFYTYDDTSKFKELYQELAEPSETIKKSAAWPKYIDYATGDTISFNDETDTAKKTANEKMVRVWATKFKEHFDTLLTKYDIQVPADTRIHWAPRLHYAYTETHAFNKNMIPVVFAGDALGGTDYKYGLNLGRGFYEAEAFVKYLAKNTKDSLINVGNSLDLYKKYWKDVLQQEFGDATRKLSDDNAIFYKYVVRGRSVNGKVLGDNDEDRQFYINALKTPQHRKLKKKKF